MSYPEADYEYLRDYNNVYANQIAGMFQEMIGDISLLFVNEPETLKAPIKFILTFWRDTIDNGYADFDAYPVAAQNALNGYTGDLQENAYTISLYCSPTGQLAQMWYIPDYAEPVRALLEYWITQ